MQASKDLIIILDFGSQYTQLIARRIREIGVYSLVKPYNISISEIIRLAPKGIIFSGGPNSVNTRKILKPNKKIFSLGIPILGICYGMQLIAREFGGKVVKSLKKEFGHSTFKINKKSQLFDGCDKDNTHDVWMSHADKVEIIPSNFISIGNSSNSKISALENEKKHIYGLQFHPEVTHTKIGKKYYKTL